MKTATYLRLSLLIPFLVWGVCLLFFLLLGAFEPTGSEIMGSNIVLGLVFWTILFYLFGILGWFLPYALLAVVLLIWSFRSQAQVLMKGFAFSPFVMAVLIVLVVNLLSMGSGDWKLFSSTSTERFEDFFGSSLWFVILTLGWGYLCVGIGFGVYKFLERLGFIRDEARMDGNLEGKAFIKG
jgi:hypothetical protein